MKKFILSLMLFLFGINANAIFLRNTSKQIVTDSKSGLMWQDDDAVQTKKNLADEAAYCENLKLGRYQDWRLPSMDELRTITDFRKFMPTLNPVFVNFKLNDYLSSTTGSYYIGNSWIVLAYRGYNTRYYPGSFGHYVRCVRGKHLGIPDNLSSLKATGVSGASIKK